VAPAAAPPVLAADPTAALVARLNDPVVIRALTELLDHADLMAVLVTGLAELVGRGDTIADSLAEGVGELRAASPSSLPSTADTVELVRALLTLSRPMLGLLPALERLLSSELTDPAVVDIGSVAARAAVRGASDAAAQQPVNGLRALLRALRDDDVSRALGYVIAIARALGQELRRAEIAATH
jgi:Protein of unknown function (DUF1641)